MASIDSLNELLVSELRDLFDAEQRLTKAIPKLVDVSSSNELIEALNKHLNETRQHVTRLEQAFSELGEEAATETCTGMKGLISEGDDHAGDIDEGSLRDAVIIGAAQRVEHYEIAAYGTAIAHARLLGYDTTAQILETTLEEEKAADRTLSDIAESVMNPDANTGVAGGSEVRPRTPA
jgi:ferritin-like metal-binding protein YciE